MLLVVHDLARARIGIHWSLAVSAGMLFVFIGLLLRHGLRRGGPGTASR